MANSGQFDGSRPGPGRPKGSKNKLPRDWGALQDEMLEWYFIAGQPGALSRFQMAIRDMPEHQGAALMVRLLRDKNAKKVVHSLDDDGKWVINAISKDGTTLISLPTTPPDEDDETNGD